MKNRCPECEKKEVQLRELEALVEMNRLDADQASAEVGMIHKALVNMGLDGVLDRLAEKGITFGDD